MRGIDVSSHNGNPFNGVTEESYKISDFLIAKVSQGDWYVNPHCDYAIQRAKMDGKLWGFYHYAEGKDPVREADFFVEKAKQYFGQGVPALDWESGSNQSWGSADWCRRFVDRVKERTGATCMLYTGLEGCRQASNCAKDCALWFAWYGTRDVASWEPPTFTASIPEPWKGYAIWQFSGSGVDRNISDLSEADWQRLAGIEKESGKVSIKLNDLAADIHKRMVEDDRFGYSWEERYGAKNETWDVGGIPIDVRVGDYDCSSSTITAWKKALKAAGYDNPLDGATYTGNMRSVFTRSGLFEWRTDFANAKRGDLLLNEAKHVAMVQGGSRLSEFCWGDKGAYGNQRGDQSGQEAKVSNWYSYPWDGYLHYIGKKTIETDKAKTVWQYAANGTDAQKWSPRMHEDGTYTLLSKSCGLALDVKGAGAEKGTRVQCYPSNGTDAQKWELRRAEGAYAPKDMAPFELYPKCAPKMRLDVSKASMDDCADVQLWEANGTNAQRWVVVDDGKGFWTLVNVQSGKTLDVAGGGK